MATIYFCTCSHSKEIHNRIRDMYGSNSLFIGRFNTGCGGANCKCKAFRLKASLRKMAPRERRSLLKKIATALGR